MADSISEWSTTAADNNDGSGAGWPEGMAPSRVNDVGRAMMAQLRSQWENAPFLDWGDTPTRTGNTTFTVSTDLTARYVANRRIKATGSATSYHTIQSSSYSSPNTTVTVDGTLPATLTTVELAAQDISAGGIYDAVDVRAFGAVGDGSTDDQAAFQLAVDAGHGLVVVPYSASGYLLGSEVVVPSNVTIRGHGFPKILQGAADIVLFSLDNSINVRIEGLHFDGNSLGVTADTASMNIGIESIDTSLKKKNCWVQNNIFEGFYYCGVRFAGIANPNESTDIYVQNNTFDSMLDEGIVLYRVNDTVVSGNRIVNHAKEAIKVVLCGRSQITKNDIRCAATGANDGPLINVGTDAFDVTIGNNFCYQGNIGIGVEKGWTRVAINSNVCVDQGSRGIGVSLAASDTGQGLTMKGNIVSGSGGNGIHVVGVSGAVITNVTISTNEVRNIGTASASNGINVSFVADALVANNSVSAVTKHGISIANNSFARVGGNYVGEIDQHGIRVESTGGVAVITDNIIDRVNENVGALDGISVDAITAAIIKDNAISDSASNMRYGIASAATTNRVSGNIISDAQTADYNGVSTYTVTNGSTDRAYDANATTVAELADVIATFFNDLGVPQ